MNFNKNLKNILLIIFATIFLNACSTAKKGSLDGDVYTGTDTVKYFIEGNTNWTFWGYRGGGWQKGNGLRIDHFLTTPEVTDIIKDVKINRDPRSWEKASDHTPVILEV